MAIVPVGNRTFRYFASSRSERFATTLDDSLSGRFAYLYVSHLWTFRYLPGRFATGQQRSSYSIANYRTFRQMAKRPGSESSKVVAKRQLIVLVSWHYIDAETCYTEIQNVWPTKAERDWWSNLASGRRARLATPDIVFNEPSKTGKWLLKLIRQRSAAEETRGCMWSAQSLSTDCSPTACRYSLEDVHTSQTAVGR